MMDKYLYAIIDENGACWVINDGGTERVEGLPWLLRQGWKPLRETPYVSDRAMSTYILICLERA
jgi:hypothetical protein